MAKTKPDVIDFLHEVMPDIKEFVHEMLDGDDGKGGDDIIPRHCQQVALVALLSSQTMHLAEIVQEVHDHSPHLAHELLHSMQGLSFDLSSAITKSMTDLKEYELVQLNRIASNLEPR